MSTESSPVIQSTAGTTLLELRVRNHPGVMSHITSLFARRAFNLESIVCVPLAGSQESRILLLVTRDGRLPQIEKQLERLHDVVSLQHRDTDGAALFARIENLAFT